MEDWIEMWDLPDFFADVPGKGATDAWYEVLTKVESHRLAYLPVCGGVADIAKFFDQLASCVQTGGDSRNATRNTECMQELCGEPGSI